jgi:hypothetical protein
MLPMTDIHNSTNATTTISRLFADSLVLESSLERKGACLDRIDALPRPDRIALGKERAAIDRSYDADHVGLRDIHEAMAKTPIQSDIELHFIAWVADRREREDDGGYSADLAKRLRKHAARQR